jgi:oligopeptidase B
MLNESLPLKVGEFEEWGNPREKPAFDYMMSSKYVAKMRALRTDHNLLLLKTNMDPAGHGGASRRYDRLKEAAFDYAFFLTQMGIQN